MKLEILQRNTEIILPYRTSVFHLKKENLWAVRTKWCRKINYNEYNDRLHCRDIREVIIEGHDIFKEAEEAKKHIGYLPEIPRCIWT